MKQKPWGRVAQLVRAPASHAGGPGFESLRAHHTSPIQPGHMGDRSFLGHKVTFWPKGVDTRPASIDRQVEM